MNNGDNVVVYRTELERTVDQFIWHGGGWKGLMAVALAIVVWWVVRTILDARRKKR